MKLLVQTQKVIIENIYLDIDYSQFIEAKNKAIDLVNYNEFDPNIIIEVEESKREIQTVVQVSVEEYNAAIAMAYEKAS